MLYFIVGVVEKTKVKCYTILNIITFKEKMMKMAAKTKKKLTSKQLLLNHLREKQRKDGGMYITTQSTSYRIFRWAFFAMVLLCTFFNLSYIIGVSGTLNAHLSHMGDIQPHQQLEIDRLKTTLMSLGCASFGIVLSEISIWFKKPFLQFLFCFASTATIILRLVLAEEIYDPTSNTLLNNHILPLAALCFCCLVSSFLYLRQLYKDKKGCKDLSEIIYKKYKLANATDISDEQWEDILKEYDPYNHVSNSTKRSVKSKKKKLEKEKSKLDNLKDENNSVQNND